MTCRTLNAGPDGRAVGVLERRARPGVQGVADRPRREEIPLAVAAAITGIRQISKIVSAVKVFAYRSEGRLGPIELPGLIRRAVEISRHEWKLVTQVELDLAPDTETMTGLQDELG